jgi:8-oxo-dGTP pyrophosphatase MutT (NUDIX family)
MSYPFNDAFQRAVAARCAAFVRLPAPAGAQSLKRAAVAVALVAAAGETGEGALLMTRRAHRLRAHGGQWALPGGRCDAAETATQAALRELEEELALRLGADDVLGMLDDYPTRSGYLITPVVVWAGASRDLRLDPAEVASVHRVPIADIMAPDAVDFVSIPESDRRVVRLHVNGAAIHAPTGAIIYQFRELLAGRATRVHDLEQPVFAWR